MISQQRRGTKMVIGVASNIQEPMRARFISQDREDQEIFTNLGRSATIALNLMALIE